MVPEPNLHRMRYVLLRHPLHTKATLQRKKKLKTLKFQLHLDFKSFSLSRLLMFQSTDQFDLPQTMTQCHYTTPQSTLSCNVEMVVATLAVPEPLSRIKANLGPWAFGNEDRHRKTPKIPCDWHILGCLGIS